ncbi:hypothetical protein THTE_3336 [Thermogutta terrifontis]|uniref:Uncharacterized protein n=1 Tax=Thermogutta terrifontis TaxID=1331910 RepID=A0A286RJ02_9BACT|nr:hypothetical protein [Thermogutta terrifontis]ASV75938.1 hypothetical protein THTE_3336 [Thermogutta terrifontis]
MGKKSGYSMETVLQDLQSVVGMLPEEEQKNEFLTVVQRMIHMMGELREAISRVPTRERIASEGIPEGLKRIRDFLKTFESGSTRGRGRSQSKSVDEAKIAEFVEQLRQLPEAELRALVQKTKLSKAEWLAAVKYVGGYTTTKDSITTLQQRLVQEIINRRTHEGILGNARP